MFLGISLRKKMKKKVIHILRYFLIFCAIILLMGLFNWGALPKAQDNPQTIDEAISAAILAHEEDPTAHLGDGESLEQHKANEVLDHPQASVVADKIGASDFIYTYNFETIDTFPDSVQLVMDYAGNPYLYLEYGYTPNAYVEFTQNIIPEIYDEEKIMTLGFGGRIEYAETNLNGYFAFKNLRFQIVAGVLKARFYRGASYNEVDLSAIDISVFHFYKIIYIPTDNLAYFYIDGLQVGSIAPPAGDRVVGNYFPVFSFTVSGGTECLVHFANFTYSRSA